MRITMKTGLSGPLYCLAPGDEVAFDEEFPFGARELGRHIDAGNCIYVGSQEDLDAWITANPDPEPETEEAGTPEAGVGAAVVDHAGTPPNPTEAAAPNPEPAAPDAPVAEVPAAAAPAAEAAPKPAAKAAVKKTS